MSQKEASSEAGSQKSLRTVFWRQPGKEHELLDVLWSDESKVNLFDSNGVQHVWRRPGEDYPKKLCLDCWYRGAAVLLGKRGFQHVLWHSEAEDYALPSETVFQHNHPKHTAEMTTALLLKVVEKQHVSNIQQLRDVIMEEWKMPGTCAALVNSMPRRIKAVLDNNDAPTKYWHFGQSFDMFT